MTSGVMICSPQDAVPLILPYGKRRQEHFGIILLDGANRVLKKTVLFVGGTARCLVDKKVVFWEACKSCASAVIVFHNHPTGSTVPSGPDIEATGSIHEGCVAIGLTFLDHIIIGRYDYFSFLEHGMIGQEEPGAREVAE